MKMLANKRCFVKTCMKAFTFTSQLLTAPSVCCSSILARASPCRLATQPHANHWWQSIWQALRWLLSSLSSLHRCEAIYLARRYQVMDTVNSEPSHAKHRPMGMTAIVDCEKMYCVRYNRDKTSTCTTFHQGIRCKACSDGWRKCVATLTTGLHCASSPSIDSLI